MASYFKLTLDTIAPSQGLSLLIDGGATFCMSRTVTLTINCDDSDVTQMKIWGGIDGATTENSASWEAYASTKQVTLSSGEGKKTINVKFRDDVYNESAITSASIIFNSSIPVVTINGPDVHKISKVSGKNVSQFTFTSSESFVEYVVKVVPSTSSKHEDGSNVGTIIGTANGSTNMSGTGTFSASTAITCTINAADLEAASSGDGEKIIKVFVKDSIGSWSV